MINALQFHDVLIKLNVLERAQLLLKHYTLLTLLIMHITLDT